MQAYCFSLMFSWAFSVLLFLWAVVLYYHARRQTDAAALLCLCFCLLRRGREKLMLM